MNHRGRARNQPAAGGGRPPLPRFALSASVRSAAMHVCLIVLTLVMLYPVL
jgi:hypothetical protein